MKENKHKHDPAGREASFLADGTSVSWHWGSDASDAVDWRAWDSFLASVQSQTVFLESRMMRSLLLASNRPVSAVQWKRKGSIIGLACIEDTTAESVNLDTHVQSERSWFSGISKVLHGKDGRFQFRVRVVGTVLGSGEHGQCWSPTVSPDEARQLLTETVFQPHCLNGVQVPRVVMIKDQPILDNAHRQVQYKGWIPLEFDPEMLFHVNPEWKHFDDYMQGLKTKSRTKIKRIMALSSDFKLRTLDSEELTERCDELITLYQRVYERSGFRLGSLHAEELLTSKAEWGDDFVVTVFELEGVLKGFQCAYVGSEETEAFFVGFDPELRKTHAIYQRMLVEFICLGVERKSKRVNMGRTALEIKSSVGALPRRLMCEVRFRNRLFNTVVGRYTQGYNPVAPRLRKPWKSDAHALAAHLELHTL